MKNLLNDIELNNHQEEWDQILTIMDLKMNHCGFSSEDIKWAIQHINVFCMDDEVAIQIADTICVGSKKGYEAMVAWMKSSLED